MKETKSTIDTRCSLKMPLRGFPLKPQVLYSPPLTSLFRSWNMKDQGQRGAITVTYEAKASVSTRNKTTFSSTDDETKNGNDLLVPEHACMME